MTDVTELLRSSIYISYGDEVKTVAQEQKVIPLKLF